MFFTAQAMVKIGGRMLRYDGEVDEDNKPCGYGIATNEHGSKYDGFWQDGLQHGVCKDFAHGLVFLKTTRYYVSNEWKRLCIRT